MTGDDLITLGAATMAFIASIIATVVSIYNARFSRFAKERWWERKADAYSRIVDALSSLAYYHEEYYEAMLEMRQVPESRREEIEEHWRRGYVEIKRATAVGAFLISEDAERALVAFWATKDDGAHPGDWSSLIDANYAAARTVLRSVVTAAKNDLRA